MNEGSDISMISVKDKIDHLRQSFKDELSFAKEITAIENLKLRFFGKKGAIQDLMNLLRDAPNQDRPLLGKAINDLKVELALLCDQALSAFQNVAIQEQLSKERIDINLPGRKRFKGKKHPLTLVIDEMTKILIGMGFSVQYGPDIDTDWYNYEGLNFPPDHSAREMQDTFYIDTNLLLRSHTSNTQLRVMEKTKPPIRIIAPGTVYRNENISSRSHVFFHQIEGLYIDEKVSLVDLFSTVEEFLNKLFQKKVEVRFRPSYFPFVEPGTEVDIRCTQCNGKGCRLCKGSGWLEIAGAGMVHPEVLKNGGLDPEKYSGYAWGIGIERTAMLFYDVPDLRLFFQNDFRFLSQF